MKKLSWKVKAFHEQAFWHKKMPRKGIFEKRGKMSAHEAKEILVMRYSSVSNKRGLHKI